MSFSVCMLCNEDADIIERFTAFYLEAGAQEILVYLDVGTPIPEHLASDTVRFFKCEDILSDHAMPQRPENFHQLQRLIYADGFARLRSDWLLICDVDEFIAADAALDDILHSVPHSWDYMRIPVAEAIWGPEDPAGAPYASTYFRTRAPKGLGKILSALIYGRSFRFTKAGLTGHAMGKYFIRRTSTRTPGIHVPQGVAFTRGPWSMDLARNPDMFVYHFEAIGYDRWQAKWGARATRPKKLHSGYNAAKRAYSAAFARHLENGTERALFDGLYKVNAAQVAALKTLGLLRRKQLWPAKGDAPVSGGRGGVRSA